MSSTKTQSSCNHESFSEKFVDPYVVLQLKEASFDNTLNSYNYDDDDDGRSDMDDCDSKRINREDIESSYRRLSVLYHPYRTRRRYQQQLQLHSKKDENYYLGGEDDQKKQDLHLLMEYNTRFVLIAASYEVLIQEETRQRFDTLSFNMKMKDIRFHQQQQTSIQSLLCVRTSTCHNEPNVKHHQRNNNNNSNNNVENNSTSVSSCFCIIPSETPTSRRRRKENSNHHHNAIGNAHRNRHDNSRNGSILSSTFCQEAFVMNDSFFDVDDDDDDDDDDDCCINKLHVVSSDEDDILSHFSSNHYYDPHCGPLTMLYRARNQQPFTHPLSLFQRVFGNDIFTSRILEPSEMTTNSTNDNQNPQQIQKKSPLPSSSFSILPFHTQCLYVAAGGDHKGFPYIPSKISASVFISSSPSIKKDNKITNPLTTKIKIDNSDNIDNNNNSPCRQLTNEGGMEQEQHKIMREIVNQHTRIKRTEIITHQSTSEGNLLKSVIQVERLSDNDDVNYNIEEEKELSHIQESISSRQSFFSFFSACNPSFAWW